MINKLFVYGTLRPGGPNEHILKAIGGSWEEGTVKGKLHPKGWGATMGFPAIALAEEGEPVDGFVFTSATLPKHLGELDAFEGNAYQRVVTKVQLKNGSRVDAYIYVLNTEI